MLYPNFWRGFITRKKKHMVFSVGNPMPYTYRGWIIHDTPPVMPQITKLSTVLTVLGPDTKCATLSERTRRA